MAAAVTLKRLLFFAANLGVRTRLVSEGRFQSLVDRGDLQEAPFSSQSLGIEWGSKHLYYTKYVPWPEVVHELGHLLACRVPPWSSDEFTFFGWEIAVVHSIGGSLDSWIASNKDYGVRDGRAFGTLNPLEMHAMLAERLAAAKADGLLSDGGRPLAVR